MRRNVLQTLLILLIVGISIQIVHAALMSVTVQVSGPDISTASRDFDPSAAATYLLDGIPSGPDRTIEIVGKDEDDNIIFTGTHNIAIVEDVITRLNIYDMEVTLGTSVSPALSAAHGHSLALKSDGNLWGWGLNSSGQLGDDSTADSTVPRKSKVVAVTAVDAGFDHSVALRFDGTVRTWGYNEFGQLGNGASGDLNYENIPVKVMDPYDILLPFSSVAAIAAGDFHTLALKSDGSVWAWGYNFFGQLGDDTGANSDSTVPVQVSSSSGLTGVEAVAAGANHSAALKSDGTVWAWGWNDVGQLGDDTVLQKDYPVQVLGEGGIGTLSGIQSVSAGGYHNVALKDDGTVWAWGDKEFGQLGDGTVGDGNPSSTVPGDFEPAPVQVLGEGGFGNISGVMAIAAGNGHTIALKDDGTVWAWGSKDFGQLCSGTKGDGNPDTVASGDYETAPVQACAPGETAPCSTAAENAMTDVVAIAAGFRHTLMVKSDGTVWACGEYEYGQLGDSQYGDGDSGTAEVEMIPVQVLDDDGGYLNLLN